MRFRISALNLQKVFLQAKGITGVATPKGSSFQPYWNQVLLSTGKAGITATSYDGQTAVISQLEATVEKPGSVLLPFTLKAFVDTLSGEVEVWRESTVLNLKAGGTTMKHGSSGTADDFPKVGVEEVDTVPISGAVLLEMLKRTIHAVSTDETRMLLNGVLLHLAPGKGNKGEKYRIAATDGHRLAYIEKPLGKLPVPKAGLIIPTTAVKKLIQLISEDVGEGWELGVKEGGLLVVRKGTLSLLIRTIDGLYPEYQRVLPKGERSPAMIARVRFSELLERVTVITEAGGTVQMKLTKNKLKVTTKNPDLGDSEDELDVAYKGDDVENGFNPRYLQEVLSALSQVEEVSIQLSSIGGTPQDPSEPLVVHAPGDSSFLAVVMPKRNG